jgi:hypothetical protein
MSHPYEAFENTPLWQTVDRALAELEHNRDVTLSTPRERIVGYLCQRLSEHLDRSGGSFHREVN